MRVAALDFGTNTFILLVAEVNDGKIDQVLHDEVRVVRLGQGVHDNRRLHPEALARAEECLKDFSATIDRFVVDRALACATSAARDVSNGHELISLAAKYRIPVSIISGEREAELTFWGTIPDDLAEPVVIVDVGGGSTEYIHGDEHGIKARRSIDVGSVRLTEMFVRAHPVEPVAMKAMAAYIEERLHAIKTQIRVESPTKLIAVAGTPTTLAAVDQGLPFDYERVDGYCLTAAALRKWVQTFAAMTVAERQALSGMDPKRADVIVAGSLILMLSCETFQANAMEVSVRGLRYGIAKALSQGEL
jgi:exopolyphosphatase/guanosine-5'-triphosphate,3'-diphosphate pyrophosphatase